MERAFDRARRRLSRLLPAAAAAALGASYACNCLVYFGTQRLARGKKARCMETRADRLVPFRAGWVWPYISFFPLWIAGYARVARLGRRELLQLTAAHVLAESVCGVFFVLLPTTNTRPALPPGPSGRVLGLIYRADPPLNLFPSVHCTVSRLVWTFLRGERRVPLPVRALFAGWAGCVCASTVLVRQHVLADVAAGLALAEGSAAFVRRRRLPRFLRRLFKK